MKSLLLFLLVFTISIAYTQESIQEYVADYPHHEEILSYLDKVVPSTSTDYIFELAKKPEGYFLRILEIRDEEFMELENVLVWDKKTSNYVTVHIPEYQNNEDEFAPTIFERLMYNASRFDFMPFYGYPNWTKDIKTFLLGKDEHTPFELELLARVYGEEAGAYIHPSQLRNNFPFAKDFEDPKYERLPKKRIDGFISAADSSLMFWEKLNQIAPDYTPFIIKNLKMKIGHDCMHFYGYLMSVKEEKLAQRYLEKVEYSEGIKQYARTILDACAKNSILITHGDTDTYPLWYMQFKEDYRTDISVLNSSLMQTKWFVQMNKASKKYNQSLSNEDITLLRSEYFFPIEQEDFINYDELLTEIKTNIRKEDTPSYHEIPTNIELNMFGTPVIIDIKSRYIGLQEIVLFDLINSNPDKNLYTTSAGYFNDQGLLLYMKVRASQLYELTNSINYTLNDDKSLDQVSLSIKQIEPGNILDAGYFGTLDLSRYYYTVRILNDEAIKEQLSEELHQKFPFDFLLEQGNIELLSSAARLYRETNIDRYKDYLDYIKREIKQQIEGITVDDIYSRETHQLLNDIFLIYGDKKRFAGSESSDDLLPAQIKILNLLHSKVNDLLIELEIGHIKWSYKKLEKLNQEISLCLDDPK